MTFTTSTTRILTLAIILVGLGLVATAHARTASADVPFGYVAPTGGGNVQAAFGVEHTTTAPTGTLTVVVVNVAPTNPDAAVSGKTSGAGIPNGNFSFGGAPAPVTPPSVGPIPSK